MSLALGDILVKILLCGIYEIFLPVFSSRTFMVSQLIFKSFIHFEFILLYGIGWWSSFIFFACTVLFYQHHLLKGLSTPLYAHTTFVKYDLTIEIWVYF